MSPDVTTEIGVGLLGPAGIGQARSEASPARTWPPGHSIGWDASLVHELGHCLSAIGERRPEEQRKVNADLQRVLFAEDARTLLDWLRTQPLLHADRDLGWMMVHASLAPKWKTQLAEKHAAEIERKLRSDGYGKLLKNMYGDKPAWSPRLTGIERERAIINVFTRLRYCSPRGRIAFEEKGSPGSQQPGLYPWYAVPGRAQRDLKIVCGHWSTLGLFAGGGRAR